MAQDHQRRSKTALVSGVPGIYLAATCDGLGWIVSGGGGPGRRAAPQRPAQCGRSTAITRPTGMLTSTSAMSARYRCSGQAGRRAAHPADQQRQGREKQGTAEVGHRGEARQRAGSTAPLPAFHPISSAATSRRDGIPHSRREQGMSGADSRLGGAAHQHQVGDGPRAKL